VLNWFGVSGGGVMDMQAHLGLVRMVKVARLARVGRLMSRLSAQMTIDTGWIEGGKFLIIVLVVSHILACLFYMVPTIVECDARDFDLALRDVPGHLVWWDKWWAARPRCIPAPGCPAILGDCRASCSRAGVVMR
jgi:hypothetical protein